MQIADLARDVLSVIGGVTVSVILLYAISEIRVKISKRRKHVSKV